MSSKAKVVCGSCQAEFLFDTSRGALPACPHCQGILKAAATAAAPPIRNKLPPVKRPLRVTENPQPDLGSIATTHSMPADDSLPQLTIAASSLPFWDFHFQFGLALAAAVWLSYWESFR
jgi:hypothetical protein